MRWLRSGRFARRYGDRAAADPLSRTENNMTAMELLLVKLLGSRIAMGVFPRSEA